MPELEVNFRNVILLPTKPARLAWTLAKEVYTITIFWPQITIPGWCNTCVMTVSLEESLPPRGLASMHERTLSLTHRLLTFTP
mgnify:CR=1 FL=1